MLEIAKQSCEKSEEEIIEEIIADAHVCSKKNIYMFILKYGRKSLHLDFFPQEKEFATFVGNYFSETSPLSNETSILYKAAAKIMQNLSDCRQEKLRYSANTHIPAMINFFKTKASAIFHWEEKEVKDSSHLFYTSFHPLSK